MEAGETLALMVGTCGAMEAKASSNKSIGGAI
jgi:hypothetical protein